jgi:RNA polymerase sigma factor (sigma-70 family)
MGHCISECFLNDICPGPNVQNQSKQIERIIDKKPVVVNEIKADEIKKQASQLHDIARKMRRDEMIRLRKEGKTLEEIGKIYNITKERVRQIKEKALRRLKQQSRSKLLKAYLG